MRDAHKAAGLIDYYEENGREKEGGWVRKALVHGIYVSSIFSSMFADRAPGCVYVDQNFSFMSPIFVHDTVIGCIDIEKIRRYRRRGIVVQCRTRIYKIIDSNNSVSCSDSESNKKQHGIRKEYRQQELAKQQKQSILTLPPEAQLSVDGRANVWLPIGYERQTSS